MALQKGWFRHAKRDFERFASLGTKRIGTWPYLSQPHVGDKCENTIHTPKSEKMESSETPENSEDNLRGQISSP